MLFLLLLVLGYTQSGVDLFDAATYAVVRLDAYAPRALRAPFAAGEQRMGTLLRTLPRPLRVGRDQHPLRRGPRDPA